jgi:hypothetical protein
MLADDKRLHRLEGDIGSEQEELECDEALCPLLCVVREDAMPGEAPDDDDARHTLDHRIEAKADQRDRGGDRPGGDRHRALDRHPAERKP